jgi:DNA-binding transcriptional regulator GbsR (MarR family)
MTSEERIKRQKELVETMGRAYDRKGFQPVCGRILALLTIMDKEQYTFDEIVEELQICKSSASNALRMLEVANLIEYYTQPGDRKRYFQIRRFDKFSLIDEHRDNMQKSYDFIKAALELKVNKNSENAVFLLNMIDMLSFFLEKFDVLKKEYLSRSK